MGRVMNRKCREGNEAVYYLQISPRAKRQKNESISLLAMPLRPSQVRVRAILPDWVKGEPPLTHVAALRIKDKRHTSLAVKKLSLTLPVPALTHLKRVRRIPKEDVARLNLLDDAKERDIMLIYLTFAEKLNIPLANLRPNITSLGEADVFCVFTQLKNMCVDTQYYTQEVFVCTVPLHPPRLREVYDKVTKLWPCVFHEDAHLTRLASDSFFTLEEIESITAHMNQAIEAGRRANDSGNPPIGCVIVDGMSGEVCVAQDNRFLHPIQHAAMVVVDGMAMRQGGGAWTLTPTGRRGDGDTCTTTSQSLETCTSSSQSLEIVTPGTSTNTSTIQGSEGKKKECEDKTNTKESLATENPCSTSLGKEKDKSNTKESLVTRNPCKRALNKEKDKTNTKESLVTKNPCNTALDKEKDKTNTKESLATKNPCNTSLDKEKDKTNTKESLATKNSCSTSSTKQTKDKTKSSSTDILSGTSYICTGCDVYLSHEPCMMCAMALLHSRVRRVFYLHSHPRFGALGSRTKLHTLPGINHRYEVFRVTT